MHNYELPNIYSCITVIFVTDHIKKDEKKGIGNEHWKMRKKKVDLGSVLFLLLNAPERRSGTFSRRIFEVFTQSNHLTSRGRHTIFWHINHMTTFALNIIN
jgi:hypothetical protein